MSNADDPTPRYHVRVDEQIYGPYPAGVLSEWIATGKVADDTPVQADGGQWVAAREWVRRLAREQTRAERLAKAPTPPSPGRPPLSSAEPAAGFDPASATAALPATELAQSATIVAPAPPRVPTGPLPRDRVVIIGRRQSGKTIYLASIYARLWRSLNGMTAKAVSGAVHQQLMDTYQTLQRGRWPAATLDTLHVEMDIDHAGVTRRMVTLDFAGEMFRKAFIEEQLDFPGVSELIDHIDRAVAVLLLVDPAVVVGSNHEAAMDDDFGLVQAAARIRNSPGGATVPIALVLTKADQHQNLIDKAGGAPGFVRQHFPALIRLLKQLPIFQISAVQTDRFPDGSLRPRPDSEPINVEAPLKFCLDQIEAVRLQSETEAKEQFALNNERRREAAERAADRQANLIVLLSVIGILLAGAAVVTWILVRNAN